MLGLDRVALLLERQGRPDAAVPTAEAVVAGSLGEALARAVALRGRGARVRFGNGNAR
jgi:hypothetical protein